MTPDTIKALAEIKQNAVTLMRSYYDARGGHMIDGPTATAENSYKAIGEICDRLASDRIEAVQQEADYVMVPREKLLRAVSVLDEALGDTDPSLPPDFTDDEVRRDRPVFWVCQQLSAMLSAAPVQPEAVCFVPTNQLDILKSRRLTKALIYRSLDDIDVPSSWTALYAAPVHPRIDGERRPSESGEKDMMWQPIETAPKDYSVVLLYQPAGPGTVECVGQGHRTDLREHAHNKWVFQANGWRGEPTHWMPLPSPPVVAETDADAQGECQPRAVFSDPITLKQTIERETIERIGNAVIDAMFAFEESDLQAALGWIFQKPLDEAAKGLLDSIGRAAIRALMPLPNEPTEEST